MIINDNLCAFSVICLSHGIAIRGGAAGGEKGSPEEAGWHTLSDGWTYSLGSRGQRPLHSQPLVCRYSLWVLDTIKLQVTPMICWWWSQVALYWFSSKGQKISPDGKSKIQLQLVLHTGESTTFHFSNDSSALKDREAAKELLQQLLPKFKKKANKELEEKNRWDSAVSTVKMSGNILCCSYCTKPMKNVSF